MFIEDEGYRFLLSAILYGVTFYYTVNFMLFSFLTGVRTDTEELLGYVWIRKTN